MNRAAQTVASFLDTKGIQYMLKGQDKEVLITGFPTKNKGGIVLTCFFDENSASVCITTSDLVRVESTQRSKCYETCSKLNQMYKWVKFYVNENDDSVSAQIDAFIDEKNCEEEVMQLIVAMVSIADEAYLAFEM